MRRLTCVAFYLLLMTGCVPDGAAEKADITGRWELERATRNNMVTEMLDGLYYEFAADSTVETNLMSNELTGRYSLQGESLSITGIRPQLEYRVANLTDSTMSLQTELQGYRFTFSLVRKDEVTD